jgi:hypothetical protein
MGQAIPGEGFFYLDFEMGEEDLEDDSNEAIISFKGEGLSAPALEAELRHLVEGDWDWRVRQVAALEFSAIFPSREMLKMSARSGKLFLPLSDTEAAIRLADADPAPVATLQEAWITLTGLPKRMRNARRLMAAMRMLGRPLEVDLDTLSRPKPVRMRIACRDPAKLNGYAQLFHRMEGFNIGIRVDPPRGSAGAPHPPPPPTERTVRATPTR